MSKAPSPKIGKKPFNFSDGSPVLKGVEETFRAAEAAVLSNHYVPQVFILKEYSSQLANGAIISGMMNLRRWRKDIKGKESFQRLPSETRLLLQEDKFLEAAIVFEIVNYSLNEVETALKFKSKDRRVRAVASARSKKTIAACAQVLTGYLALKELGFFPGPDWGIENPHVLDWVLAIYKGHKHDLTVLTEAKVRRRANGKELVYRTTPKARFQDNPRYLVLHLRELLRACLDIPYDTATELLVPIATDFGALIESESDQVDSLKRKLKACSDSKKVKSNFIEVYGLISGRLSEKVPSVCLRNLSKKIRQ